jgi:hypothetical protein
MHEAGRHEDPALAILDGGQDLGVASKRSPNSIGFEGVTAL